LVFVAGKHTIPSDTMVILNVFKAHRNRKFWGDDANFFIPERFEADKMKNVHSYAYLPFAG
jgi:cytochrome P450